MALRCEPLNDKPLSDNIRAGSPHTWLACSNAAQAVTQVHTATAIDAAQIREWSSMMLMISTTVPSASVQCVESICHKSLGRSHTNRFHELLGRFLGSTTTSPRRRNIRQIVASDGT